MLLLAFQRGKIYMFNIRQLTTALTITILSILTTPSFSVASEGGASGYLQGTYGEFASGILGPSGFYMRNDLFLYDASIGVRPLGGNINSGAEQKIWGDLVKFAYISDFEIWGGRYNAAVAIPLVLKGEVSGNASAGRFGIYRDGNVNGIGDIYITPFALGWNWGYHHLNANISFVAPTGSYDASRLLNVGRNYWSFDPTVYYTWLHPERGHEVTITLGYMMNTENSDTDYTTGNEMHLDWTLAQHFSESFAIGVTGYWYEQVTDDKGDLPLGFQASNFKGRGVGVGPTVLYTQELGGKSISFIGKWITDIESKNRMEGDLFMLSAAFKF